MAPGTVSEKCLFARSASLAVNLRFIYIFSKAIYVLVKFLVKRHFARFRPIGEPNYWPFARNTHFRVLVKMLLKLFFVLVKILLKRFTR